MAPPKLVTATMKTGNKRFDERLRGERGCLFRASAGTRM
jgi:hypothetical protein